MRSWFLKILLGWIYGHECSKTPINTDLVFSSVVQETRACKMQLATTAWMTQHWKRAWKPARPPTDERAEKPAPAPTARMGRDGKVVFGIIPSISKNGRKKNKYMYFISRSYDKPPFSLCEYPFVLSVTHPFQIWSPCFLSPPVETPPRRSSTSATSPAATRFTARRPTCAPTCAGTRERGRLSAPGPSVASALPVRMSFSDTSAPTPVSLKVTWSDVAALLCLGGGQCKIFQMEHIFSGVFGIDI